MKRLELTIEGTVQDVSFRAHTEREAGRLGLAGTVWNNQDGTVGVIAEGSSETLQALLDWAGHGPEAAQVTKVDSSWSEATGEFTGFQIRY